MIIILETSQDTITLTDRKWHARNVWGIRENGVTGLFGTPAPRESYEARPQMDGEYWPSRYTQKGRDITIQAVIRTYSSIAATLARQRVNGLFGQRIHLTVQDAIGSRSIDCALADDPEPSMMWRENGFTFSLVLHAPDPLLYGQPVTVPVVNGMASVENTGDAPSWPVISTTTATALAVSMNGRMVKWTGAAKPLTLDFATMIPSQGTITYDDAFPIPPGSHTITITSDGDANVTLKPAWR